MKEQGELGWLTIDRQERLGPDKSLTFYNIKTEEYLARAMRSFHVRQLPVFG